MMLPRCPNCGEPILFDQDLCEHCGVDIASAVIQAYHQAMLPQSVADGNPISPEILVPRIGDYLIENGLLNREQLQEALAIQGKKASEGKTLLLGQALCELGYINQETLDQAITAQILHYQNALKSMNQSLQLRVEERTQELQRALTRLSELNQLKTNFIANISHELRTPLTHIKGYLDILSDGGLGALNDSQAEALKIIRKAEERLEHLVEDLIQFSLTTRGALTLNKEDTLVNEIIRAAIDRSINKAKQKGITLESSLDEMIPAVSADREKIDWVIIQLLDNAIKFTPEGGQVTVETKFAHSGFVSITIMDTGIGIPDERVEEIFEPFHQLDGSSTRRFAGTGLGLTLVRQIIEAHGSHITVLSREGKGSCFEFHLPIAPNAAVNSSNSEND